MTLQQAVGVAEACGVSEPVFYGEVIIKIRGGEVVLTKISQEFITGSKQ